MDHYKVLGLHKSASKEEIKAAFKKLAFQFHPDKHSQSPKSVKDNATLQFKQVSEAYEVLMDDRKRADYNYRWRSGAGRQGSSASAGGNYYYSQYSYGHGRSGSSYEYKTRSNGGGGGGGFASKFEVFIRILTAKSSLLNLGFAAAILGAMIVVDTSGESLWKMQNSGKSFEEAMNTIGKTKSYKEDNMNERP
ncbi:chaperone protein dnaJ [Trifolium repens]|nr:chaperone protein dnaJ [Trifolium repens]